MEHIIVILGFLSFIAYIATVNKAKEITTAVPGLKYEHIGTGTEVLVIGSSCTTTTYIMKGHEYEMSTATFMNEFSLNEHTGKN